MMTAIQMRERADYYFRRARDEGDDQHRETLIDLAIDFDKIALDLENWERGRVSPISTSRNKHYPQASLLGLFRFGFQRLTFSTKLGWNDHVRALTGPKRC